MLQFYIGWWGRCDLPRKPAKRSGVGITDSKGVRIRVYFS